MEFQFQTNKYVYRSYQKTGFCNNPQKCKKRHPKEIYI